MQPKPLTTKTHCIIISQVHQMQNPKQLWLTSDIQIFIPEPQKHKTHCRYLKSTTWNQNPQQPHCRYSKFTAYTEPKTNSLQISQVLYIQTEPRITSWTLCKYPKSTTCRQKPKTTKTHSRYSDTRPAEQPRLTQVHSMQPEPLTTKFLCRYLKSTTCEKEPQTTRIHCRYPRSTTCRQNHEKKKEEKRLSANIQARAQKTKIHSKYPKSSTCRQNQEKTGFTADIPSPQHAARTQSNQDAMQIFRPEP